jgi:hypothetical protein
MSTLALFAIFTAFWVFVIWALADAFLRALRKSL